MCNFKVGQRVVCIEEDNFCPYSQCIVPGPLKDEIYIVGWVGFSENDEHSLGFDEFRNDDCWLAEAFRPVDEDFVYEVIAMINAEKESAIKKAVKSICNEH